jgi:hypothetical protein
MVTLGAAGFTVIAVRLLGTLRANSGPTEADLQQRTTHGVATGSVCGTPAQSSRLARKAGGWR